MFSLLDILCLPGIPPEGGTPLVHPSGVGMAFGIAFLDYRVVALIALAWDFGHTDYQAAMWSWLYPLVVLIAPAYDRGSN